MCAQGPSSPYLCLPASALLDHGAGHGTADGETLEKPSDGVAQAQGEEFLAEEEDNNPKSAHHSSIKHLHLSISPSLLPPPYLVAVHAVAILESEDAPQRDGDAVANEGQGEGVPDDLAEERESRDDRRLESGGRERRGTRHACLHAFALTDIPGSVCVCVCSDPEGIFPTTSTPNFSFRFTCQEITVAMTTWIDQGQDARCGRLLYKSKPPPGAPVLTASSSTGMGTGILLLRRAFSSLARTRQTIATMLTTRVPTFVCGKR